MNKKYIIITMLLITLLLGISISYYLLVEKRFTVIERKETTTVYLTRKEDSLLYGNELKVILK